MLAISNSQGDGFNIRTMALVSRRGAGIAAMVPFIAVLAGCTTNFRHTDRVNLTAARPTEKLVLSNSVGSIHLTADAAATEVRAEVSKTGKGYSNEVAREAKDEIEVRLDLSDDGTTVRASAEHPSGTAGRGYEVTWLITAPANINVEVQNEVGDIRVEGFAKAVSLRNGVGDAVVTADPRQPASMGPVHVDSEVGDVHVHGAAGGLTVMADVGDVHATAGGKIDIRNDVGDVTLKLLPSSGESVRVNTDVGDICFYISPEQQGKLIADCDTGSIRMNVSGPRVKELHERHHHATAQLGEATQPMIDLSADVGDVTIGSFTP